MDVMKSELFWLFVFSIVVVFIIVIVSIYANKVVDNKTKQKEGEDLADSFFDLYKSEEYFAAIRTLESIFIKVEPHFLFEQNKLIKYRDFEKIAYCYFKTSRYKKAIEFYNYILDVNNKNKVILYNRAIAKYKLNSNDTEDLEKIYNEEQPFIILNKEMHLKFNDEEQKMAKQTFEKKLSINRIGNIFGVENTYS